jgi:hypothetical protein
VTAGPRWEQLLEDKLEQAGVTLAYEGKAIHRIATVRALLSAFSSGNMPARRTRPRWTKITRALLVLDDSTATVEQVRDLRRNIDELRQAVRDHRGNGR